MLKRAIFTVAILLLIYGFSASNDFTAICAGVAIFLFGMMTLEEGFKAFSAGKVTIPRVIYLPFDARGDLHLKGAHKKSGASYVFKIATGFPGNSERGLLPTQGLMMAFAALTGAAPPPADTSLLAVVRRFLRLDA